VALIGLPLKTAQNVSVTGLLEATINFSGARFGAGPRGVTGFGVEAGPPKSEGKLTRFDADAAGFAGFGGPFWGEKKDEKSGKGTSICGSSILSISGSFFSGLAGVFRIEEISEENGERFSTFGFFSLDSLDRASAAFFAFSSSILSNHQ